VGRATLNDLRATREVLYDITSCQSEAFSLGAARTARGFLFDEGGGGVVHLGGAWLAADFWNRKDGLRIEPRLNIGRAIEAAAPNLYVSRAPALVSPHCKRCRLNTDDDRRLFLCLVDFVHDESPSLIRGDSFKAWIFGRGVRLGQMGSEAIFGDASRRANAGVC
jgi:hypothetical protein